MYPQVFGKYVLERELARGGMARVHLATLRGAVGFEKKLVVKQIRDELALDPEFVRRFVEEAKTTVALSHPNIVPVYELGVERGVYFLTMEFVEGVSVAELLDARGGGQKTPLTPEEGAYLGVEICRALDYAHRRMKIVHRDITPRNVMVDDEGQVKLIDFGIAARARAEAQVFGSPGHMPPEQMAGETLTPATDLFAVAVLLMEAWSGRAPFRRSTPEACEEAMRAPHPKPGDIDPRLIPLDDLFAGAMALDPSARPPDAEAFSRALRKYLQDVDLGDVARSLGALAREARERADARRERASGRAPIATDGTRRLPETKGRAAEGGATEEEDDASPAPPSVTRTFAARDEARIWSEAPPPAPEIPIETIATRPIETPVGGGHRAPAAKERTRARWPLPLAAAALGLTAWWGATRWARDAGEPSPTSAPANTALPSLSSETPAPRPAASAAAVLDTPPPSPTPAPSASFSVASTAAPGAAPANVASRTAAPDPSVARAKDAASVSFFGDPGTSVAVDGVARGACPLRGIPLEPGPHTVRFAFEPTGETTGGPFVVPESARGGELRLRASFTGATPTMRVEALTPRRK